MRHICEGDWIVIAVGKTLGCGRILVVIWPCLWVAVRLLPMNAVWLISPELEKLFGVHDHDPRLVTVVFGDLHGHEHGRMIWKWDGKDEESATPRIFFNGD